MNLQVVQNGHSSLYAVYVFRDFLHEDYLSVVKDTVLRLTEKDVMDRKTNVKATMSNYTSLLEDNQTKKFFTEAMLTIDGIYQLRSCHTEEIFDYKLKDAWAMKHLNRDYTQTHMHYPTDWSGAFYIDVPQPAERIDFLEFSRSVPLESNMLVLFPGMVKHSVSPHLSEEARLSLAFNIDVEKR